MRPPRLSPGLTPMRLVLPGLTVLYIFWQISLSGAILTAADMETSRRLSSLARWTVGLGGFLFVFRLTWGRPFTARLRQARRVLPVGLGLVAGALFVCAEDAIVDHYAARADAQARMEAKTIQLFGAAFLKGKVRLPDLAAEAAQDPVKARAFLKVLGFAIWSDPTLIAEVNSQRAAILGALQGDAPYRRIDSAYADYAARAAAWQNAESQLRRIPYAEWAALLNPVLGQYAACTNDQCRAEISSKVKAYLGRYMQKKGLELPLDIDLDAFCETRHETRYVMGREVRGGESRTCAASEQSLRGQVDSMARAAMDKALERLRDLPPAIRSRVADLSSPLSLEAWRALFKSQIDAEIEKRLNAEFGDPARYAEGAPEAAQGRDYAISVFLPPVALGFSVLVCLLHLANVLTMLFRHALLWSAGAAGLCLLPLLFATPVPLSGMAGLYARWLMQWEALLYPFGIFRGLIL
ncbi:MAG: hypothetical protein K2J64_02350 [Desulfovibrio sp.]|nr:hypothetical protein [Desulfovibrio sp.]